MRLKRFCRKAGCQQLTAGQYCEEHQQAPAERDRERGTSAQRGYGHRWRKARATYLLSHPVCVHCRQRGRVKAATDVDHIKPHRGDQALFWSKDNWQALCTSCHSTKTAKEDGGYGNG